MIRRLVGATRFLAAIVAILGVRILDETCRGRADSEADAVAREVVLQQALGLHKEGHLQEAAEAYSRMLEVRQVQRGTVAPVANSQA